MRDTSEVSNLGVDVNAIIVLGTEVEGEEELKDLHVVMYEEGEGQRMVDSIDTLFVTENLLVLAQGRHLLEIGLATL